MARNDFFEAFKNYDEAGVQRRDLTLTLTLTRCVTLTLTLTLIRCSGACSASSTSS